MLNEDDELVTTAAEVVKCTRMDINAALDVITKDETISEDTRAALIRKFEEVDELLDEARIILGEESSGDE